MKCIKPDPKIPHTWLEVIENYDNLKVGYRTWVRNAEYVSKCGDKLLGGNTHIENNRYYTNYPKHLFKIVHNPNILSYDVY